MVWVSPLTNLFFWAVYFASAIGCIYFYLPHFGGWGTLDMGGKTIALLCAALCLASFFGLVTAQVIPPDYM